MKGTNVAVRLSARPIAETAGSLGSDPITIDEKPVRIDADEQSVEFTWTPAETGRFIVAAEADAVPGEPGYAEQSGRPRSERARRFPAA